MSADFRQCHAPPLEPFTASAPDGVVIGVVGDEGSGKRTLLRLAAHLETPVAGEAIVTGPGLLLGPFDALEIGDARTLALFHTLCMKDLASRARAAMELERFRRRGGTAFLVSHDLELHATLADEIWWIDRGWLVRKGDPREMLEVYRRHAVDTMRAAAAGSQIAMTPTMRKGDGRAELLAVETLDENGRLSSLWRTDAETAVRVVVKFQQAVNDPVVGILIRTRIGFEVYGTNTELERARLGPCAPGDTREIIFRFRCGICPGEYTLTAASHDPDGVWHDWIEDGVAITVADHRYTAGVACLRAEVEVRRAP